MTFTSFQGHRCVRIISCKMFFRFLSTVVWTLYSCYIVCLSWNILPQSSKLAEPLWTDPGIKSWISVHKLISTLKKQTKAQAGNEWLNILLKSSQVRKKPSPFAASIKHSMHCVTGGYLTKGHSYFCTLIWVMWAFALLVVNLSVNLPLIGRNQAFSELHSHFRDSLRAF